MFARKKDLEELTSFVSTIHEHLAQHTESLSNSKQAILDLTKTASHAILELEQTRTAQDSHLEKTNTKLQEVHDEFTRALEQIKLQHKDFEHRILQQLHSALKDNLNTLRSDSARYKDVRDELHTLRADLKQTREEISKLRNVTQTLKKEDFEASQFAKQIFSADREKLRLMQENDKLKTIIAKRRRNR